MATRHLFYAYMVSQATEVAAQLKQTISIQIQPKFYRGNNCAEIELWYHADTPTFLRGIKKRGGSNEMMFNL